MGRTKWCRRYCSSSDFDALSDNGWTLALGDADRRRVNVILQELELLDDDANVYKLIGPVLVKQDLAEAKANVNKRLDYITAEL